MIGATISTFQEDIAEALHPVTHSRFLRVVALALYYLAILLGLILLYGRGDFSNPPFVYQGF